MCNSDDIVPHISVYSFRLANTTYISQGQNINDHYFMPYTAHTTLILNSLNLINLIYQL